MAQLTIWSGTSTFSTGSGQNPTDFMIMIQNFQVQVYTL